ncbi:MAG: hypothetical protein KJ954_14450 [Alphaproteobacteria bacterium]|nr:hypothetical protein [Alphaproteobacteria bacterium]
MKDWIPTSALLGVAAMLMYLLLSTQVVFTRTIDRAVDQIGFSHELLSKLLDQTERQEKEIAAWHRRQWQDGKSGNPKERGRS